MDQKELLEIARAAMKNRGRKQKPAPSGRGRGRSQEAPARRESRSENVESALSRIAELDRKVREAEYVEGAEDSIQEVELRATEASSVRSAEASLAALEDHIQREHSFADFDDPPTSVSPKSKGPRSGLSMRDAFRLSLLFGPPKALE